MLVAATDLATDRSHCENGARLMGYVIDIAQSASDADALGAGL